MQMHFEATALLKAQLVLRKEHRKGDFSAES